MVGMLSSLRPFNAHGGINAAWISRSERSSAFDPVEGLCEASTYASGSSV